MLAFPAASGEADSSVVAGSDGYLLSSQAEETRSKLAQEFQGLPICSSRYARTLRAWPTADDSRALARDLRSLVRKKSGGLPSSAGIVDALFSLCKGPTNQVSQWKNVIHKFDFNICFFW